MKERQRVEASTWWKKEKGRRRARADESKRWKKTKGRQRQRLEEGTRWRKAVGRTKQKVEGGKVWKKASQEVNNPRIKMVRIRITNKFNSHSHHFFTFRFAL